MDLSLTASFLQLYEGRSTRVQATDTDGPGLNSEVSYDKEGEDRDKFSVDKDTGVVTVAAGAVLDRETDQVLELIITAEDHATTRRTTLVTMTITLEDENDNIPVFTPQFGYAVVVPEDTKVGTVLTTAVSSLTLFCASTHLVPSVGGSGPRHGRRDHLLSRNFLSCPQVLLFLSQQVLQL